MSLVSSHHEAPDSLLTIMAITNEALPIHGVGVISPEAMGRTGSASCFGRLAVIGSQLIAAGGDVDRDNLSWLIGLNHGLRHSKKHSAAKYWYGHAFLAINGPEPALVDCMKQAFTRELDTTTWSPALSNKQILPIVDRIVAEEVTEPDRPLDTGVVPNRAIRYARVWALRAFFSHHTFDAGMAFYQDEHPLLRKQDPLIAQDYANFYSELVEPRAVA
jgi:hypothetical protein